MNTEATVLIVEDDLVSAEYLKAILQNENYNVLEVIDTGAQAIQIAHKFKPDIILMDVMLKDHISGCDAALQIHQDHPETSIIFITAYADDEMIEYADQSEAYAYLLKPYREKEILATVKLALTHHKQIIPAGDVIKLTHHYTYNTVLHKLCLEGKEVAISKKALKLFEILVRYKDTVVSHEQICHHIWGEHKSENTLRSLVYRTRAAIGADLIKSVNSQGYIIQTS